MAVKERQAQLTEDLLTCDGFSYQDFDVIIHIYLAIVSIFTL